MISKILLEKYNKPIPRYTSYPPANFFKNNLEEYDYINAIIKSNEEYPQNISIYIHIPFCKKLCYYCGCNTSTMRNEETIKTYIKTIIKEMKMCFKHINKDRKVSQIHYGGGTPNTIPVKYLREINEYIFSEFGLLDEAEIAIECSPAYLDKEYIKELKTAKFNRFSLGIQDFNREVLKVINRDAPTIPIKELIDMLKEGNNNVKVNLDFIYGLPYQTKDSFRNTIMKGIEACADRIVTFSYAHVPWINKAMLMLEKAGLPNNEEKIAMYEEAYNTLCNNGYTAIGLDHYAKDDDELKKALDKGKLHRNFQGYCTTKTTGQVYAFGVSGISQFKSAYVQTTKDIKEYIRTINDDKFAYIKGYILNTDEEIIRYIIEQIMCNKGVIWEKVANYFSIEKTELDKYIPSKHILDTLRNDGIIEVSDTGINIKEEHILFIRNVAAAFDPLLKNTSNSFSKPV